MSSTIEPSRIALRRLVRFGVRACMMLSATFGLFALIFAATGEAPAALVMPAPAAGPAALPEGVRVLRWSKAYAIVTSDRSDYVRRLYGKGAVLVLPVRKNGCVALATERA